MLRLARRELLRWSARYLGGLPPPQGSPCSQKRWRKYWKLSKQKSTRLCRMTRRCASQTRSPSTDSLYKAKKSWRRSTWSATSRWCPLSSSSFFTSTPSSHLWSSRSQPGCGPCSKLVEGLWLSARRSHRSSEVHRLPTAGVQVRIFALGLRLLLLFCLLPL